MILFLGVALLLVRSSQLNYDQYSFYKSSYFSDQFGNQYTSSLKFQTFNDDQTYMALSGSTSQDPVQIYYR